MCGREFQKDPATHKQFLWGWNKDEQLFENIHMQWSNRTKDYSLKLNPELKEHIKVSGGVGFDRYALAQFQKRTTFLTKYDKAEFKKIIGVGCWDFGPMYPEDNRYAISKERLSNAEIERFKSDGIQFRDYLSTVIQANPTILFILKEHPGRQLGRMSSGIDTLDQFKNVLVLKNEEGVSDCISISDFWLVYESTTALEAWLLGKQTCKLNPSGEDFFRDKLHEGSPNYLTATDLQKAINGFYKTGNLPAFHSKKEQREQIIEETIQYADGLNHVRAGNEIIQLLQQQTDTTLAKETTTQQFLRLQQKLMWDLAPFFKYIPTKEKFFHRRNNFSDQGVQVFSKKRLKEQMAFYQKKQLTKESLRNITCL